MPVAARKTLWHAGPVGVAAILRQHTAGTTLT